MKVTEAIRKRRSIGLLSDKQPEKEKIEKMLESARWAPNHHKTEPWHFYVLSGQGREKLGEAYAKIQLEKLQDPSEEDQEKALESGMRKAKRSPVVIVATVEPHREDKIEPVEEIAATACAIQNILLTAEELELATKWRTGKPVSHPIMKECFGISDKGWVLGLVFVGYPKEVPATPAKKTTDEYTTWYE